MRALGIVLLTTRRELVGRPARRSFGGQFVYAPRRGRVFRERAALRPLADDHAMFRQGVREMLSTDEGIEVVGEAENGREAVALAERLGPDVVLLDVEMPVMGAREAMGRMLVNSPPPGSSSLPCTTTRSWCES